MIMKTTTAIQKSRDEFEEKYPSQKGVSGGIYIIMYDTEEMKSHITTSQKDILSALIEDMEILRQDTRPMEDGVPVETYGYEETYNQALKDTQDIIRKAMEV